MRVCVCVCVRVPVRVFVCVCGQSPHSELEAASFSWTYEEIKEVHKRWWQLRDNAVEIFLTNGRTLLLAFDTTKVRGFSRLSPCLGSVSTKMIYIERPHTGSEGDDEIWSSHNHHRLICGFIGGGSILEPL